MCMRRVCSCGEIGREYGDSGPGVAEATGLRRPPLPRPTLHPLRASILGNSTARLFCSMESSHRSWAVPPCLLNSVLLTNFLLVVPKAVCALLSQVRRQVMAVLPWPCERPGTVTSPVSPKAEPLPSPWAENILCNQHSDNVSVPSDEAQNHGFQLGAILHPRTPASKWRYFWLSRPEARAVLLASHGRRPGMLLKSQYAGRP